MSGTQAKGGKKNRKHGRNKAKANQSTKRYTAERRWETNKIKRMKRHIKKYPEDKKCAKILSLLP